MRRSETQFASNNALMAGRHLGTLVRQARLARRWTLDELAERSKVSPATLKRIETGSVAASLGGWLAVLERLGLLSKVIEIRDPVSEALLDDTRVKRSRKSRPNAADLDF